MSRTIYPKTGWLNVLIEFKEDEIKEGKNYNWIIDSNRQYNCSSLQTIISFLDWIEYAPPTKALC